MAVTVVAQNRQIDGKLAKLISDFCRGGTLEERDDQNVYGFTS